MSLGPWLACSGVACGWTSALLAVGVGWVTWQPCLTGLAVLSAVCAPDPARGLYFRALQAGLVRVLAPYRATLVSLEQEVGSRRCGPEGARLEGMRGILKVSRQGEGMTSRA